MINLKLSSILTTIAEVSKFQTGEQKIVINLSRAARTIRDFKGSIAEAFKSGILEKTPGIDSFSYGIIKEYFETGSIKLFEKIKEKYPEDLIKIVRLSGIGTKRVFNIYEKFNIKTLEDLKDLFALNYETKNLAESFGIDCLFLERVRHSVNYFESLIGKYPRWLVLEFAEEIIENLQELNELFSLKVVGSLRRRKSTVGDIDILLLPEFNLLEINLNSSDELINKISRLSFVKGVIARDKRKENISARFSTVYGIDVEIIITSKKMWPSDLLITTGSKSHLAKLKDAARGRGCFNGEIFDFSMIEFNELKQYKNKDSIYEGDSYICQEEKQIYDFLGMQYIYPELRERFEEVELAKQSHLPELVKLEDIKGDLHVHSNFSDGIMDMKEIFDKADKYNYEYLSFSDHSESNLYGNGLDKKRLDEKILFVKELNANQTDITFLCGSEIEIDEEGRLDYEDDFIGEFDIALGSIHKGFKFDAETNNMRFENAMKNKNIDIIAHPTGVVFGSRAPYFLDIENLIECSSKYGKAIEINSYFLRLDLNEENSRKAKNAGIMISINTDSHRPNNLDMMRLGVDIARKAGLEKNNIINAFGLNDLKKWKKSR
ncbi:MAG: PHP domain-containing protein [Actinobacteria bacterium]|nr:PHP domain-containing protein [Actinomycetota bacterium]